jgi:hypothetical protein
VKINNHDHLMIVGTDQKVMNLVSIILDVLKIHALFSRSRTWKLNPSQRSVLSSGSGVAPVMAWMQEEG